MKKYLLVVLIVAWSNQVFSTDIDLYIDDSDASVQRPNVLIILDNSPSMVWYGVDGTYLSDRQVNNPLTRANVARRIVIDLINDNPEVDFALQLFNANSNSKDGGRIVFGLKDLSQGTNRADLISILDNDTNNSNNNYKSFAGNGTPLCETLYETYRYLSGGYLYYGNDDTSTPQSIISSEKYTSPFAGITCNKEINIIYITDGDPTIDDDANNKVKTLTGTDNSDAYIVSGERNFFGVLGRWMATRNWLKLTGYDEHTKLNTGISDTQKSEIVATVKIHTVGFGSSIGATNLLKLAARDSEVAVPSSGYHSLPAGGEYYPATTGDALKDALDGVILTVLANSTLTSASVSANSFDRTQTLDAVYYGMFEPSTAARWQGNLKKYKIVNGEQKDANGNAVIDATGEFDEDSKSFWSDVDDGNEVAEGGVAEMLRATATIDRTLLTDVTLGADGKLTEFSESKVTAEYDTNDKLIEKFELSLSEVTDIDNYIKWAMGVDVDAVDYNSTSPTVRADIFGDPLHSKPIVINYGDEDGNSRIVVGTNAGVLHMFEDVSDTEVKENWAYLPKEFFKNIKPLRENAIAVNNKIYGLDGEITLHINDSNNNGKVDGDDTAWLFFGVRRGGSSYYALDITTPGTPKLMWHIENTGAGAFNKLGLTFSQPQVVKSAFNTVDTDQLVVIFGGGYDTKKDNSGPNTVNDTNGAAIYMVNARTGALIFKKSTGENNGIASSIASLDSDSDGFVDRLYVGDTGGNLWRLDMPDENIDNSSIIKLASLAGATDAEDRRFFYQPSIVRTYILETYDIGTESSPKIVKQEVPYDAILLGSGDRATPIDGDTDDMFFMIKDKYIKTQKFGASATTIPTTITLSGLYDYTDDPFNGYPILTSAQEAMLVDASEMSGWYFDLEQTGEKNSGKAIVINNVVYFTTYTPSSATSCSVVPGDAWLYAVDLALGIKKYNWSIDTDNRDDKIKHIGNQYIGAPTLISTPVIDVDTGETNTEGNLIVGKEVIAVGFTLQTMRTSLTIPES